MILRLLLFVGLLAPLTAQTDPYAERWSFAEQRRVGRYKVLMPTTMGPYERLPLVCMLHGNGNAPDMMATLARTLDLGRVIVICPEAPYVKIAETIEARTEKLTAMQVAPGAPDSLLPRVIDLSAEWYKGVIDEARRTLPVDTTRRTMLIGFSQGGFFAHVLLTRHPDAFSHMASICASMYAAGGVVERYPAVVPFGVKVLVAHGTTDDVVPFQTGELIHGQLERAGIPHVWLPFDGGHWPTAPVIEAIRNLMR